MAAYAISRQRTLLGKSYSFVQRRPGVHGLGDDLTPPDIFGPGPPSVYYIDMDTGVHYDYPCASCGPGFVGPSPSYDPLLSPLPRVPTPPGFFTNPRPIIPPKVITPVTPPNIGPGPVAPQIVFPSGGTVAPRVAAAPAASWFDQQLIAGFPNSYLALAVGGLVLFVSMSGAKRRR